MVPREFMARYGKATWRQVTVGPVGTGLIPPDPDRYVLIFWATSFNTTIRPGDTDTGPADGVIWSATGEPITIDHSHHGAAVNLGWTVGPLVAGQTFTYIEGRMTPSTFTPEGQVRHGR